MECGTDLRRDVMTNEEVVDFVERFRSTCPQESQDVKEPVDQSRAVISHLLCEEARYRWFGIVEEEDVMVDDISCVVVQIRSCSTGETQPCTHRISKLTDVSVIIDETMEEVGDRPQGYDPLRNSVSPEEEMHVRRKIVRKDLVRGSIVEGDDSFDS